jgi:hypothetical protein
LSPGLPRYRIDQLVYAEPYSEIRDAIAGEKQIKAWRRAHRVTLIDSANPEWNDLGEIWFGPKDALNLGSPHPAHSSENDDEIPPSAG